eukprot:scaffold2452_cov303-Prasinococcus_capsulatus_cf.AAC.6
MPQQRFFMGDGHWRAVHVATMCQAPFAWLRVWSPVCLVSTADGPKRQLVCATVAHRLPEPLLSLHDARIQKGQHARLHEFPEVCHGSTCSKLTTVR